MKLFEPLTYVIIGIIVTAGAQIVLKIGSNAKPFEAEWIFYIAMSLVFYVISFLSYYLALRYYDISKIQPIMTATITIIVISYGIFAGEEFGFRKAIGILLGIVAVFLMSHP